MVWPLRSLLIMSTRKVRRNLRKEMSFFWTARWTRVRLIWLLYVVVLV